MAANLAGVTAQAIGASNGLRVGVVLRVVGGQPVVDIGGAPVDNAGTLASYTPVAGDTVAVLRQESTWLILGRIVGRRPALATAATMTARTTAAAGQSPGDQVGDLAGVAVITDADFAASDGAETVTGLVLPQVRLTAGTAYEVVVATGYHSAQIGQAVWLRLRRDGPGGAVVGDLRAYPVGTAEAVHSAHARHLIRTTGEVVTTLAVTVTAQVGAAAPVVLSASALAPAYLDLRVAGPADAFPHAAILGEE